MPLGPPALPTISRTRPRRLQHTDSVEQPSTLRQQLKTLVGDGLGVGLQTLDQPLAARGHISTKLTPVCFTRDTQLLHALFHPYELFPQHRSTGLGQLRRLALQTGVTLSLFFGAERGDLQVTLDLPALRVASAFRRARTSGLLHDRRLHRLHDRRRWRFSRHNVYEGSRG